MAYTSEIEKLEQRYRENPKGRNFAPLADAYRKAGLIDNAIELCQEGLKLHPDYISAYIVYGRCRMDTKDAAGAEEVFRKVLALDAENVLALRTLAEIAERGNRPDEAMEWLSRLLAADPMNGDAAEALARVKGKSAAAGKPTELAVRQEPEPPAPPQPPRAPLSASPSSAAARAAVVPPPPRPAPPVPPPSPSPPPEALEIERTSADAPPPAPDLETFDGTLTLDGDALDPGRDDGIELQDDAAPQPDRIEVEGLARTQYESGIFVAPAEAGDATDTADDLLVDLPLILPDDIPPARAAPPPDSRAPRRTPPPPSAPAPPRVHVAAARSDDDGAADRAALSRAEPVVTETMAELYLKQGHQEDALRVYQALLTQRPGDSLLRRKVATLSGQGLTIGSGQSAGEFLRGVLHGQPAAPAAPGSTLGGAFGATEMDGPAPGAPTRLADDAISLDALFGEADPHTSAVPAAAGGGVAPAPFSDERSAGDAGERAGAAGGDVPARSGGFSFDEFFSSPTAGAGPGAPGGPGGAGGTGGPVGPGAAGGAGGAGGAAGAGGPAGAATQGAGQPGQRNSGRQPRAVVDDEGDLDQFQAWLKKLKS